MDANSFNMLSLCSGIDGIGIGVKRVVPHARTVCHVEREVSCCEILEARMQDKLIDDAPIWTDLATFDGVPWRGVVDIVVAGIPCQGNSLAGKRQLEDDPRNLWPSTRRILREVEPNWFFLENVYGILVPGDGRPAPICRILGELAEDGFDAEWITLSAADIGASQRRERMFLLARSSSSVCERHRSRLPSTQTRVGCSRQLNGDSAERSEHDRGGLELASGTERGCGGVRQSSGSGGLADGCDKSVVQPSGGRRGKREQGRGSDRGAATGGTDGELGIAARHGGSGRNGKGRSGRRVREGSVPMGDTEHTESRAGIGSEQEGRRGGGEDLQTQAEHYSAPSHQGQGLDLTALLIRFSRTSKEELKEQAVAFLRSLASGRSGSESSKSDQTLPRRRLNPLFVEWLMGFPEGWISVEPINCELLATA